MERTLAVRFAGELSFLYQEGSDSAPSRLSLPPTLKAQSLLAYLILHREQSHPRQRLMGMFWGERPEHKARRSLSTALWHIRRCFPTTDVLEGSRQEVEFRFQGELQVDIELFEKHAAGASKVGLQRATDCYGGEFLDGFYDDWVINERHRLQSLYIEVMARLMRLHEVGGDHREALSVARELLVKDPLREDAHRLRMRAYCAIGRRSAALEQYGICERVLQDELNVEPAPKTVSLYQRIADGTYAIGPSISTCQPTEAESAEAIARSPLGALAEKILVGRDEELALLEAGRIGQANCMLIAGEAGLGKTSLLKAFADRQHARGARVLWGRCYEFERSLPYQPIAEALQPALERQAVTDAPEWVMREIGRLTPNVTSHKPKEGAQAKPVNQQEQHRFFFAVSHFLEIIAATTPTIVVLEDLHWATASTLELLHFLLRQNASADHALYIVGSYRPEIIEDANPLRAFIRHLQREAMASTLDLSPLTSGEVETLLRRLSGAGDGIVPLARRLYKETEGNPFYLIELTKALFEAGALAVSEGAWDGDYVRISRGEIPGSANIYDLILGRVERMRTPSQEALRTAAVLGREFDLDLFTAACAWREEESLEAIEDMLNHRIIDEGSGYSDRDYVFTHHKIQEVVYASIPTKHQEHLHAKIGRAIEEQFSNQLDELAYELAYHFTQASRSDRSLSDKGARYLLEAGQQAADKYANADALGHYDDALSLIGEGAHAFRYDLLMARERVLDTLGSREAQSQDIASLEDIARDLGLEQQAEVMLRKARLERNIGEYSRTIDTSRAAMKLAPVERPDLIAEGNLVLGTALLRLGEYEQAQPCFLEALELASHPEERWLQAYCLNGLGLCFQYLGYYDQANQKIRAAVDRFRQIEDSRGLCVAINNLGVIANERGDHISAQAFYGEALELHRIAGNRKGEAIVTGNLGNIALAVGDFTLALQRHEEALEIAVAINHQLFEANALLNTAMVYLAVGAHDLADDYYQRAHTTYRQIGNQTGEAWALTLASAVDHRRGHERSALRHAQSALHIADEIGDQNIQGYALTQSGHAQVGLSRLGLAREAYARSLNLRRELGQPHLAIESMSGLMRVSLLGDQPEGASAFVEETLQHLKQGSLEGTDEPLLILLTCYRVLSALDDHRKTDMLLKAHTLLMDQADRIPDGSLRRTFLEEIPAHRQIRAAFVEGSDI